MRTYTPETWLSAGASLLRGAALLGLVFGAVAAAQSLPSWAEPATHAPAGGPSAAMSPGTPGGGSGPGGGGTNQVPIDGGLGMLAAAGAAYAMRRLRRR